LNQRARQPTLVAVSPEHGPPCTTPMWWELCRDQQAALQRRYGWAVRLHSDAMSALWPGVLTLDGSSEMSTGGTQDTVALSLSRSLARSDRTRANATEAVKVESAATRTAKVAQVWHSIGALDGTEHSGTLLTST